MCYAIPAQLVEIKDKTTGVVDYFGEKRNILLDLSDVAIGDYVYAQGGIMVRKIANEDALEILDTWKDVFFELKKTDQALARLDEGKMSPNALAVLQKINLRKNLTKKELVSLFKLTDKNELSVLYEIANNVRQREHGNSSCVHGIIEFSNYCRKNCHYCGIRKDRDIKRYRMSVDEIVSIAEKSSRDYGFKALVLQSGEDDWYDDEKLTEIVSRVRALGILIFLSIGARDIHTYKKLYESGARGALIRFESSNDKIFSRLKPGEDLTDRVSIIRELKRIGYIIATGFLQGVQGETDEDIVNNILLTKQLGADMYSFGPIIPTTGTPLSDMKLSDPSLFLKTIAIARLADANSNILVTTAMETIDTNAPRKALLAGANSMMINLTPEKYKKLYAIYNNRSGSNTTVKDSIESSVDLLFTLGRAPTDLGDVRYYTNKNFIAEEKIEDLLKQSQNPSTEKVKAVISKARGLKGLTHDETAFLLQCEDKELNIEILKTAQFIKNEIYGRRLVLFAPLYISNYCANNCLYCGFRKDNKELHRVRLTIDEICKEVEAMEDEGHKRLLLVAGEDSDSSNIEYLEKSIKAIYSVKKGRGAIRRLNVNVAPLTAEGFKRLKRAGIGTYQLFQETYHYDSYKKMHPEGPKSDFYKRLCAMDQAQKAGIDDVGIGVLFGLYDHKFEVLALLSHAKHLEEKFGVGPHTISVPRINPAYNTPFTEAPPHPVSDSAFKKLVAILRLAVPYTGIILSTREPEKLRNDLIELGVSQISAGSRTNPGAYNSRQKESSNSQQFTLCDERSQLEVIKKVVKKGHIPSFCTACYRLKRTGKDFMDLAKPGEIKNFCTPNSLLTFCEYALDYGDDELKMISSNIIDQAVDAIENRVIRNETKEKLLKIKAGRRDLFF